MPWHADWEPPKGSSAFKKMKRRRKPFEQVELPVESEDGFKCEKCNGFFETRNLLHRHLEHGKGGCGGKCYGDGSRARTSVELPSWEF